MGTDMKKLFTRISSVTLALAIAVQFLSPYVQATDYSDVASSDWYAEAVEYVTETGLMSDMGDGKFARSRC